MENKGKKPLTLEEKIEEHKAFLRYFQCLIGRACLVQIGGVVTIERRLIMIDALVATAQAELQLNYNASTLADYLYSVFIIVRNNRLTADAKILAVEAEYQHRGGTGVNQKHSVVLFTAGSLYEHISGKGLSTACR